MVLSISSIFLGLVKLKPKPPTPPELATTPASSSVLKHPP
tara:strand:+ start:1345 stop:1464 length:120 start_codon:yes stop_codon:yes gene_type:complete